jgi:REP element-mobilizing transposase RayT
MGFMYYICGRKRTTKQRLKQSTMKSKLKNRKTPRAKWHCYNEGDYFVTFCTKDRKCFFGSVVDNQMEHSEIGDFAQQCIEQIPEIHPDVTIPEYVVMPNHIHLIVRITPVGLPQCAVGLPQCDSPTTQCDSPTTCDDHTTKNEEMQRRANRCGRLSHVIGQFKGVVTKYAHEHRIDFGWQPRFHDRIIRNNDEMIEIVKYIRNNPALWVQDRFHPL